MIARKKIQNCGVGLTRFHLNFQEGWALSKWETKRLFSTYASKGAVGEFEN